MKKVLLIGLVLLMSAAIPLTGIAATPKPQYGGVVVYDVDIAKNIGYPAGMVNFSDWEQSLPAIETLLRYDKKGNMEGLLATAWEASPDLMTIKLTLRKGVKFHDGTTFNAEAVKWNLDTYRNSKKPELKALGSVDILDDYTVQLNMEQFDSQILRSLCEWAGLMISPTAVKKHGEEYFRTHSIGTGAFILEKFEPAVSIRYTKNNNYWQKGKPYLDGIKFISISDDMVAFASLKSGEMHIASIANMDIIKQAKAAGDCTVYVSMSRCTGLIGDSIHRDSPFAKLKVLRAVAHAIDVKTFTESLRGDLAQATNQLANPTTPYYNPDIKGYPYNPERAKQLLKEAGYPNGFKTTLLYPGPNPQSELEMSALQSYLAKVGIQVELNPVPFPQFLETRIKGFTGMIHEMFDVAVEREPFSVLTKRLYDKAPTYKTSVHFPADYIDTINRASREPDYETRMKLNRELVRMVSEKYLIHIPLFLFSFPKVVSDKVHNIGIEEYWVHQWNPEEMWLEK